MERPRTILEFAALVAAYRKALIQNGVPDELVDDLVRDWHARCVERDTFEHSILLLDNKSRKGTLEFG